MYLAYSLQRSFEGENEVQKMKSPRISFHEFYHGPYKMVMMTEELRDAAVKFMSEHIRNSSCAKCKLLKQADIAYAGCKQCRDNANEAWHTHNGWGIVTGDYAVVSGLKHNDEK
jgi:hypothetical protein